MARQQQDARLIPPDACTWCGHPPHLIDCSESIKTSTGKDSSGYKGCPCARR